MTNLLSRTIKLAYQKPELRQHLLPIIKTAISGFHGSHLPGLQKIIPDPQERKVMSSLGTWATLSQNHALMYGDRVYEVEIPDGNFMDAPTDNFNVFWFDENLIDKCLDAETRKALKLKRGAEVLDYFRNGAYPDFNSMKPMERYPLEKALSKIQEIIFRNWDYLKSWKSKKMSEGYDGIVWKNSGIDVGKDKPHTVYLVFGEMDIIKELSPEEVKQLSNPRRQA